MSYQSAFKDFYKTLVLEPFWPITNFTWIYYHWMGSNFICGTIFSGIMISVHLASWIFVYSEIILKIIKNVETNVLAITYYYIMISHTLIVPFIVIVWMMRGRERIFRVISSVTTVDEILSKFNQRPSKNKTFFKLVTFLIIFPFAITGGLVLNDINSSDASEYRYPKALWMIEGFYHDLIELFVQYFFTGLVSILGDRYKAVNSTLKKISEEHCSKDLWNVQQLTADWIVTVRELRAVHRKLFFVVKMISEAFGLQLLIIVVDSLTSITNELYILYLGNVLLCSTAAPNIFRHLLWCSMHTVPILIMAFCSSRTSAEEKYTAVLLEEISIYGHENLRTELSTFSLQMIHYDIHFSVCGLYDIDLPFVTTIIATVLTYLLILLQVENVPSQCQYGPTVIEASENMTDSLTEY